jgi:hypothetical protein
VLHKTAYPAALQAIHLHLRYYWLVAFAIPLAGMPSAVKASLDLAEIQN